MNKDVTFVLMTCGEDTEAECLAAVAPFRDEIEFAEVRNVCPQVKALNQMIDSVMTEFFVPLDADIVLDYDAWPRVKNALGRHRHDPAWHSILFPLYDTLTERKILALKVMRASAAKEHKFADTATPDVEHYRRLTEAGFTCVHDYLGQKPIGRHVVSGHRRCYSKYRDVYQTYRANNFEWDSGVFVGGEGLRGKAKAHFDYFLRRYASTGDGDYLSCIAGMVDGITSPPRDESKTLDGVEYKFGDDAVSEFMNWYMLPEKYSGSMVF